MKKYYTILALIFVDVCVYTDVYSYKLKRMGGKVVRVVYFKVFVRTYLSNTLLLEHIFPLTIASFRDTIRSILRQLSAVLESVSKVSIPQQASKFTGYSILYLVS